jgi:hypothetical protein
MPPKFTLENNPLPPFSAPLQGFGNGPTSHLPPEMQNIKRAINFYADYAGCGLFRMIWPEYLINIYQKGVVSGGITMIIDPRFYTGVKSVRLQRQAISHQVNFIKHLKEISKHNGMKLIYEVDDVIFRQDIPLYNACRHAFDSEEVEKSSTEAILLCNEMSVCSEYMKEYYQKRTGHPDVKCIPNYLPKFWMDGHYDEDEVMDRYDRYKRKPRVAVFTSSTHIDVKNQNGFIDDFTHVNDIIIKTCKDIQWVIIGSIPIKLAPYIKKGWIEHHPWVNIHEYPKLIKKVNANISFAPLIENEFNKSKSDIKILEAGAFGIPCICQDIVTYKNAPVKFTTGDELLEKIVKLMKNESYYADMSKKYRAITETRWLEDHIDEYVQLYGLN